MLSCCPPCFSPCGALLALILAKSITGGPPTRSNCLASLAKFSCEVLSLSNALA